MMEDGLYGPTCSIKFARQSWSSNTYFFIVVLHLAQSFAVCSSGCLRPFKNFPSMPPTIVHYVGYYTEQNFKWFKYPLRLYCSPHSGLSHLKIIYSNMASFLDWPSVSFYSELVFARGIPGGRILLIFLNEAGEAEALLTYLSLDLEILGRIALGEDAMNVVGLRRCL